MAKDLRTTGDEHYQAKEYKKAVECYTQAIEAETDLGETASSLSSRSAAYIHLGNLDKALEDAKLCIERKPDWSTSHARAAEAYSRLQDMKAADLAYSTAVRLAEDGEIRSRLTVAANAIKRELKQRKKQQQLKGFIYAPYETTWISRFYAALDRDPSFFRRSGGLELMVHAYKTGDEGLVMLDRNVVNRGGGNSTQRVYGVPLSNASQLLSEAILLEERAIQIPAGSNPSFPLHEKLEELNDFDWQAMGVMKYLEPMRWSPKDVIADFNRRLPRERWFPIRRSASMLSRGMIIEAFQKSLENNYSGAVQDIKFACDLLEEGNRIWPNETADTKGHSFDDTFVRIVKRKLIQYSLDAALNAKNKAAKKKHSLGTVETLALELLEENPQALWPPNSPAYSPLVYYVMPSAHAYIALAVVSAQRGLKAVESDIPSGGIALAKSDHTRKAAEFYDLALELVPEDYYLTPMYCWNRLEIYLRLGGVQTAREILAWSDKAEEIQKSLERFFDELAEEDDSRTFVQDQVQKIRDWLASSNAKTSSEGVEPIDQIVKAVPTLNLRGTSPTFDSSSVLTDEFWSNLKGDIRIVHVLPRE